jgi:putative ABC transport system ATP-binding protein
MEYSTRKPNILIRDLSVIYNAGKSNEVRALSGITLDIYPEEYLIIFGPSGCGKSTLLYSISGLQKMTRGTVTIDDQDINILTEMEKAEFHRRKIGMIFQAFYLVETLSVLNNVCLPKIFTEDGLTSREEAGRKLLERFGIVEQAEKFSSELSGGQKQRVAIARSLINDPGIIFADEPVGNLDSQSSFNVMSILSELNIKDKKTVILVTHDPAHLAYGDRIVHMRDGKIIKIEEVLDKKMPDLKGEGWELVKREPGEEIVKIKKDKGEEIYKITRKNGEEIIKIKRGDEWVMVKREILSPAIAMLMRSFKNFSIAQLGMLFAPFKAQELFSHIVFNMPDEDLDPVKKKLQEVISGNMTVDEFQEGLDLERGRGGAGWDKRSARRFADVMKRILEQVEKVDLENIEKTASAFSSYLVSVFELKLDEAARQKLEEVIRLRLNSNFSVDDIFKILDLPKKEGGIGLDKRVAFKASRELEMILLLKFAG